jgi:hypothetical protein
MHSDVAKRLSDTIQDKHRGTGKWASYIDHNGDGDSGDCIYNCDGDIRSAPYEIQSQGGKQVANVDIDSSKNVVPRTTYEEEADDDDNYASMMEAGLYTKGPLPLCERFISKGEREKMAPEDFAGKGKSFPINTPGDISAAVHSMGRAGDKNVGASTLKARIIAIAKRKGWTKYLPKAWQGDGDTSTAESAAGETVERGTLKLCESVSFPVDIELREAFTVGKKIKLIAPGKGSSAWYTEAALKQAASDKIFHAGLPMRIDHPTKAEEAARPEGSVKDWGAVLAHDAEWLESYIGKDGKDSGKGLYSEIKPFSDHAQTIQEKGPYAGVSIRANGSALHESGKPVIREGVPVLHEFTSAEGADMVTRAGAGGLFLSESARAANQQEVDMTEADVKRLVESATAPLRSRALRGDALVEATRVLSPLNLHEAAKQEIITRVLDKPEAFPLTEGALDTKKFEELVMAEAKRVAALLGVVAPATVRGLGIAAPVEIDAKEAAKQAKRERKLREAEEEGAVDVFQRLGMPEDAAKIAAKGRAA